LFAPNDFGSALRYDGGSHRQSEKNTRAKFFAEHFLRPAVARRIYLYGTKSWNKKPAPVKRG
jgi:hypothetical protein